MRYSQILFATLATIVACSTSCISEEKSEDQKRAGFLAAYNDQKADKRLASVIRLDKSKEQRSIEMLYFVSWRDPDPEVRSRAFSVMVHCEDVYGYTAYFAADSFKRETELGVKVEKAVAMVSLRYKWSALNELVAFLGTLRWGHWNYSYGHAGGYVAAGDPPPVAGEKDKSTGDDSGYAGDRNREPLRWRNEEELIAIIADTINRMSGTKIEARPRVDQEIVKWWERKSDLWADYDRKLRVKTSADAKEIQFKDLKDAKDDEVRPGNDTLRKMLAGPKDADPVKEIPAKKEYVRRKSPDDE